MGRSRIKRTGSSENLHFFQFFPISPGAWGPCFSHLRVETCHRHWHYGNCVVGKEVFKSSIRVGRNVLWDTRWEM